MEIKVNIAILSRRMGDIVKEGDSDYSTFKMWAENKDRKMGVIIGEFIKETEESGEVVVSGSGGEADSGTQNTGNPTEAEGGEEVPEEADSEEGKSEEEGLKCDQCEYIAKSKKALHMHKLGKHGD